MAKCAFIGLGVMGYPMAGHLSAAGHEVRVFNRTSARADKWLAEHAGCSAPSPAEAAAGAEFVFVCVGDDPDVREVVTGDAGVLRSAEPGSLLVDHTTTSAALASELHVAAAAGGIGFVDAPISGGEAGAVNGALTVMCGGKRGDFDRAAKLIACYARACNLLGGPGAGQLTKMVNQICIAGLLQGLSEGIDFALRAGLDVESVIDTISLGAAGSWQMQNRAVTMAQDRFDFGFAVDWMRKDLRICLAEAERIGASLPIAEIVDGFYAALQDQGHGRSDTSSLIRLLRDQPADEQPPH